MGHCKRNGASHPVGHRKRNGASHPVGHVSGMAQVIRWVMQAEWREPSGGSLQAEWRKSSGESCERNGASHPVGHCKRNGASHPVSRVSPSPGRLRGTAIIQPLCFKIPPTSLCELYLNTHGSHLGNPSSEDQQALIALRTERSQAHRSSSLRGILVGMLTRSR